jgi:hypothetical protein
LIFRVENIGKGRKMKVEDEMNVAAELRGKHGKKSNY